MFPIRHVRLFAAIFSMSMLPAVAGIAETAVKTENCSVAGGHDANGNIVICGLTAEQLRALTKELTEAAQNGQTQSLLDRIETLSKRLGTTQEATKSLLRAVGRQGDVPDEKLGQVLAKIADQYSRLQAEVASLNEESPLEHALKTQARVEITAGHLDLATNLLEKAIKRVATLHGKCTNITAMGVGADPELCSRDLINTEYTDNRVGFVFTAKEKDRRDELIIAFIGSGSQQRHPNADTAIQPIDRIVFTFEGTSDHLNAYNGVCEFTNPYKGVPSTVSCRANTGSGSFSGEFISNGVSPNTLEGAHDSANEVKLNVQRLTTLKGKCTDNSHVADGVQNEDLSKKRSRFFCDQAIIYNLDDQDKRKMINFVEGQSYHERPLGFAGTVLNKDMMVLDRVYLEPGHALDVKEGFCKFFYKSDRVSAIVCGAKVEQGNRRTVPLVSFEVGAVR